MVSDLYKRITEWTASLETFYFDELAFVIFAVGVILAVIVYQEHRSLKREVGERAKLQAHLVRSERMESVGQLASGIAHDFNNTLTVILSYSDICISRLPDGDPLKEDFRCIQSAGESAAFLASRLTGFSRQKPSDPEQIDLNDAVKSSSEMLRCMIDGSIDIKIVADPDIVDYLGSNGVRFQVVH